MNADLSAEVEQLYKIKSAQYIRARNRTRLPPTLASFGQEERSLGTEVTSIRIRSKGHGMKSKKNFTTCLRKM
jgi:hypothetical protein